MIKQIKLRIPNAENRRQCNMSGVLLIWTVCKELIVDTTENRASKVAPWCELECGRLSNGSGLLATKPIATGKSRDWRFGASSSGREAGKSCASILPNERCPVSERHGE